MLVMKFGGTSVGSVEAFCAVAKIVGQKVQEQAATARLGVIVVTSAMSGVTNLLIDAAQQSALGHETASKEAIATLRRKHLQVIDHFLRNASERSAAERGLERKLQELDRICGGISVLGELTPRGLDLVSGLGERINAPILAAVLRAHGIASQPVDAVEIVVTDSVFGGADPLMERTEERCRAQLLPMIEQGVVPVVTGFVGATVDGIPTTLSRGGSDYSAGILGAVLDADEIQIWTDVNGVMTCDPRIVPHARSIRQLSYEEVAELAYYGAKVLHPKTVIPALQKRIPVRVLNTFEPDHPGTAIVDRSDSEEHGTVKAVTAIRSVNLITIAGKGMMGMPGVAARAFGAVSSVGTNILMISQSSSELNICFVIPEPAAQKTVAALYTEFAREVERGDIERIDGHARVVIVAVVGSGMRGTPGLAAGVFGAVAKHRINVIAIAQGSSEANISFVVAEDAAATALRAVHDMFELEKPTSERSYQRQAG
ncbi:MAG: aspartate kinase [Chloroflexi bacterium]|nr:MAG: aspartate kinase [Chloroflexota bacterium]